MNVDRKIITPEIVERYELTKERISEISKEPLVEIRYKKYFINVAKFLNKTQEMYELNVKNEWKLLNLEKKQKYNYSLYCDILSQGYEKCYGNPEFTAKEFGKEIGDLLSVLYYEMRATIAYGFEQDLEGITICQELFIQIYNIFEQETVDVTELKEILYWYASDYCDVFLPKYIQSQLIPGCNIAQNIIQKANKDDYSYLYDYGEFVSQTEVKTAEYLGTLSNEKLKAMAQVIVGGFSRGFEITGKELSKKSVVNIQYVLGFELLVKEVIKGFNEIGLQVSFFRSPVSIITKKSHIKTGYFGAIANHQYEYDHKDDRGLFLDKKYLERRYSVSQTSYEHLQKEAAVYAGPAVIETFGQEAFAPVSKEEAAGLSETQRQMSVDFDGKQSKMLNQYIKPEERSYTIIAFPTPDIGENFEEIFEDVLNVNTLDASLYERVQQTIIDALDKGSYVEILGANGNKTKLTISLTKIENHEKETGFENCVADVNIPVGEVFTSPVLKGTSGLLQVSKVYLNELLYENLEITFKDGKTTEYSCSNFDTLERNKNYIKENLLYNRPWLPMGEFAIGTNTTAYAMAKKHNIHHKLPILIAEKMGPHFAIGDTCYSHSEEIKVYNPNGKEIIARDNEISKLRNEQPQEAYFQCHTDITIPYEEIGEIAVYDDLGNKNSIIINGRFVLKGTEVLNEPLD